MGRIPGWLLVHAVTVEPYLGESSTGALYGPARTVRCFLDEQTRTVRTPAGDEVTSTSTAYALPSESAPPKSKVTLPSGRITKAIQTKDRKGGRLRTPDHVEIQLE